MIDAYVAIKFFLPEVDYEKAGDILENHNRMIAPDFFSIEFDAIVTKKVRHKLLDSSGASQIFYEVRTS